MPRSSEDEQSRPPAPANPGEDAEPPGPAQQRAPSGSAGDGPADQPPDGKGGELPTTLAAAVALLVAALAAVGVSGDVLTRTVRNQPLPVAGVVTAALVVAGLYAGSLAWRRDRRLGLTVGALVVVLSLAVVVGARSVAQREEPGVSLSSTSTATAVTVAVHASGSGLRSTDTALVQVQAMSAVPDTWDALPPGCRSNRLESRPSHLPRPAPPGPLLVWEQAGPDSSGDVSVDSTLELAPGAYAGVCAYVALSNGQDGVRTVLGVLRLPPAGPTTTSPAGPATSSTAATTAPTTTG